MKKVQLDVLGFFYNRVREAPPTMLLGEVAGYRVLTIMVGVLEAHAISLALEGNRLHRPIMHDIFKDTLLKLGYTVQEITITTVKDGAFFAQISMTDGKSTLKLDARPSDAIAIGLRFKAPLFIDEALLNKIGRGVKTQLSGEKPSLSMSQTYARQQNDSSTNLQYYSVEALKDMLADVVAREDYEQAAQIRDELQRRGVQ
ncbi:MAG: bifunctional nuclease domain-containing protein [Bacteroidota bacterium]